jgi:hypothetical protein
MQKISIRLLRIVGGAMVVLLTTGQPSYTQLVGGEVHGSIFALVRGQDTFPKEAVFAGRYIFLPDITVYLKNLTTGATSPTAQTNLDGTFAIPSQSEGQYQICWKAPGYLSGCSATTFVLRSANINLNPVGIEAEPGVIYGHAALKDGAACRFIATFLGKNTSTTVSASVGSSPAKTVHANSYGDYFISAVSNGAVKVEATCEGAHALANATMSGAPTLVDLTLPNARPKFGPAYAELGGKVVRAAAAGSTVHVSVAVQDGGGYPLHYRWAVDPPTSGFTSADAPAVDWTIPPGAGMATIWALAYDNQGGNILSRVHLSTVPNRIDFSGHVLADNSPAVQGAVVTINGVASMTNSSGNFELFLPKEEPRYVVTITKSGYQMLSRVLYAPVTQGLFKLYQAQDFVVNPTGPISITERPPPEQKTGVQIQVPANSLAAGATGSGALATGPLHIRVKTYNLRDAEDQLPGDYGGIDKSNQGVRMETYGAADIAIEDNAGNPFNLASGKTATLRVPIDPAMAASAPPTIPVWHYDSKQGLWVEDGVAMKVGGLYETTVTHFSAVNMDLAFNSGACTRIVVDTSVMPVPFRLRMTPLTGGFTVDANHQNQIVGGPPNPGLNVVVREPPGIQVRFDVIDSNGNPVSAASQTITTGAASPSGIDWNPPPNPPYADCTSEVDYNEQTILPPNPPPPGFLVFQSPPDYLNPATAEGLAEAYYAKIDPGGTKTTLPPNPAANNDFTNWKTANGFNRAGETRVVYQNLYDLGFGRDMHMQTGGQDGSCTGCIAYYVTNYNTADDAASQTSPIATVAMEYGPPSGGGTTSFTRFYVFANSGANAGAILTSAALDESGQKYVPALCVICHNGNIAPPNETGDASGNLQIARFLPFDLDSFAYPTAAQWARSLQEPSFKAMNSGVLNKTNPSVAEQRLITLWYGTEGDTSLPNSTFNGAAVPTEWTSPTDESNLYNVVVKPSCRSCHSTRDESGTPHTTLDLTWDSYDSLNSASPLVHFRVCGQTAPGTYDSMPQAERTYARFWLSTQPNAPDTLAASDLSGFQSPNNTCPYP